MEGRWERSQTFVVSLKPERRDLGSLADHVIVTAMSREGAKRQAQKILLDNQDQYIVTPISNPDESVYIMGGLV